MALVKICPTCLASNAPTSPFCSGCGVSLVSVAPTDPAEIALPRAETMGKVAAKAVCPECGAENVRAEDRCVYCDCVLNGAGCDPCCPTVELTWPWGKQVLDGSMRIGRDPPAPEGLINAISAHGYDNISRSHAELRLDSAPAGVTVVDLGSSNGTFVDGVRIPANTPIPLKSGAIVRFAARLSLSITIHLQEPLDAVGPSL